MDQPPPPYPGGPGDVAYPPGEKGGQPGQEPPPAFAPPVGGYAPPPGGYPPPPAGYAPPPGAPPPAGAYPPPPGGEYGQPMYPAPQYGPAYGPGQPGYQPCYPGGPPVTGQPMVGPTVVVQQPGVTTLVQQFRETPVQTVCPHCGAQIVTGMHFETGTFTWLICALLCLVGCDGGCCLIPFCVDGCKDVVHDCPNCQRSVSRYNRL